jgi:hypothetical protein
MEIIVEIYKAEDGRPAGFVRSADMAQARPFSGNLEFLALVEDLYLAEHRTTPSDSDDGTAITHTTSRGESND